MMSDAEKMPVQMILDDIDDLHFRLFMAGFQVSGEGFNGEYVGPRYRNLEALEARLRPEFNKYKREVL